MKKTKRLLIAALMAIGVTGSSTLAYFTSEVDLVGKDSTMLQLKITNGKVNIAAAYGSDSTEATWYYDPVDVTADGCSPDLLGLGANKSVGASDLLNANFVTAGSTNRWKKGAPVIGAITNARPGDGFSMGQILDATSGDKLSEENKADGVKIINNSNITIKITIDLKDKAGDAGEAAFAQYKMLTDAGWRVKVGNTEIAVAANKEDLLSALQAALSSVTSLSNGQSTTLKMQVYLPKETGNDNQAKETFNGEYKDGFDIRNIFVIKAVQENYE